MLVQVTAFSFGGFVVGVTWNHGVGDTMGIAQFLQAVGEMARLLRQWYCCHWTEGDIYRRRGGKREHRGHNQGYQGRQGCHS